MEAGSVVKVYSKVFTSDRDATLRAIQSIQGGMPEFEGQAQGCDLIGIGSLLIVAGTPDHLAPMRDLNGPVIVRDLSTIVKLVEQTGGLVVVPNTEIPGGQLMVARHADGLLFEYIQWAPASPAG